MQAPLAPSLQFSRRHTSTDRNLPIYSKKRIHLYESFFSPGLSLVPQAASRENPCRVLLLSAETDWCREFKSVAKRLGFRVKRLDNGVDALVNFHAFDPHLFVIADYRGDDEVSLVDLCNAVRIPRRLRPLALIVTTAVTIPNGEDVADLGVDEILDAKVPADRYSTSFIQHSRVSISQRCVLDRERDILDSLPDALMVVDGNLTLWKINRASAELFGLESCERLRRRLGQPLLGALRSCMSGWMRESFGASLVAALATALHKRHGHFECREMLGHHEHFLGGEITRLEGREEHFLVALRDSTDHGQTLRRETRQQRLATLGNLSVGVAQEMQNSNTVSRVNAGNLKELFDAMRPILDEFAAREPGRRIGALTLPSALEQIDSAIARIDTASRRIATVLDSVVTFGKESSEADCNVSVRDAVSEAVILTTHLLRDKAELTVELPANLPGVRACKAEISQVFVNLIENACQAFDHAGSKRNEHRKQIRIELDHVSGEEVVIAVRDNGPGIDEDLQQQIFRPFFTARAQGEGGGLGLSIASDILHRFGGDLTVRSRKGEGATFLVSLRAFEPGSH